jgi:hypothetical protein
MKKSAKYIFRIGLALVIAGFLYDVVFAGIPYQDAPADLQNEYVRDQEISLWIMRFGLAGVVIGGLVRMVDRIRQPSKKEVKKLSRFIRQSS